MKRPVSIGVVCTGNTCRSPVFQAWLVNALSEKGVEEPAVWSAGLEVSFSGKPGVPFTAAAAAAMKAPKQIIAHLEAHRTKSIANVIEQSDHIIWITGKRALCRRQHLLYGATREERMKEYAKRLGSQLHIVIAEDRAKNYEWFRRYRLIPENLALAAYIEQAQELRDLALNHELVRNSTIH